MRNEASLTSSFPKDDLVALGTKFQQEFWRKHHHSSHCGCLLKAALSKCSLDKWVDVSGGGGSAETAGLCWEKTTHKKEERKGLTLS